MEEGLGGMLLGATERKLCGPQWKECGRFSLSAWPSPHQGHGLLAFKVPVDLNCSLSL